MLNNDSEIKPQILRVGVSNPWGQLIPGMQHTLVGSIVMSQEFEGLVRFNKTGVVVPQLAKSWRISDDFREYEFEIDTTRQFANGEFVSADKFKQSWEYALSLQPQSTNASTEDVFYLLEGRHEFESKGSIAGIVVKAPDRLLLKFQKPFRLALDHLAGVRYAVATKDEAGRFYGTGTHHAVEANQDRIVFEPNSIIKPLHLLYR